MPTPQLRLCNPSRSWQQMSHCTVSLSRTAPWPINMWLKMFLRIIAWSAVCLHSYVVASFKIWTRLSVETSALGKTCSSPASSGDNLVNPINKKMCGRQLSPLGYTSLNLFARDFTALRHALKLSQALNSLILITQPPHKPLPQTSCTAKWCMIATWVASVRGALKWTFRKNLGFCPNQVDPPPHRTWDTQN